MVPEYNPEPLKGYFTSMKIPYYIVKKPIADYASRIKDREEQRKFCYKARRKLLIKTALRYGFNVVAVCHTLDDLAENFILSLFCNGKVHTTNARYYHKGIRMIKPLAYSRSRQLKEFC